MLLRIKGPGNPSQNFISDPEGHYSDTKIISEKCMRCKIFNIIITIAIRK
jgi:hypothetical protein